MRCLNFANRLANAEGLKAKRDAEAKEWLASWNNVAAAVAAATTCHTPKAAIAWADTIMEAQTDRLQSLRNKVNT